MVRKIFGSSLLLLVLVGPVSAKDPGEFWKIDYQRFERECDRKNNLVDTPYDCKFEIARMEDLEAQVEEARRLQDGFVSASISFSAFAKKFQEKYPRVWKMRPQVRSDQ